jgi:hypothetical protein
MNAHTTQFARANKQVVTRADKAENNRIELFMRLDTRIRSYETTDNERARCISVLQAAVNNRSPKKARSSKVARNILAEREHRINDKGNFYHTLALLTYQSATLPEERKRLFRVLQRAANRNHPLRHIAQIALNDAREKCAYMVRQQKFGPWRVPEQQPGFVRIQIAAKKQERAKKLAWHRYVASL